MIYNPFKVKVMNSHIMVNVADVGKEAVSVEAKCAQT